MLTEVAQWACGVLRVAVQRLMDSECACTFLTLFAFLMKFGVVSVHCADGGCTVGVRRAARCGAAPDGQ